MVIESTVLEVWLGCLCTGKVLVPQSAVELGLDLVQLNESNKTLFADVPSQKHLLKHDIDVDDLWPIKQHLYCVNPDKHCCIKQQVEYMVQHGIVEPSCNAWSSPCLLADKANGEDRFCTDFRKVKGVTKPNCYLLPWMDDCWGSQVC